MSDSEQEPVTEINTQAEASQAEPPKEAPKKRGRKPKGGAKKPAEKKAAVSTKINILSCRLYDKVKQSFQDVVF